VYRKTSVTLPIAIRTDEEVRQWLEGNPEDWEGALDLDVSYIDPRATCDDHEICDIDVTDGQIEVEYRVDYSSYAGCRDITEDDSEKRRVKGQVMGAEITFETLVPDDGMSPSDEL